jgi:hypothetical protein
MKTLNKPIQHVSNMESIDFGEYLEHAKSSNFVELADEVNLYDLESQWAIKDRITYTIHAAQNRTLFHMSKDDYHLCFDKHADPVQQIEGLVGLYLSSFRDMTLSILCGAAESTGQETGLCVSGTARSYGDHYGQYAESDMLLLAIQALSARPTWLTAPLFTVLDSDPTFEGIKVITGTFFLIPNTENTTSVFVRFGYCNKYGGQFVHHVLVPVALNMHPPSTSMESFGDMVVEAAIYFAEITNAYEWRGCPRCHKSLKNMKDSIAPFLILSGSPCLRCIARATPDNDVLTPVTADDLFGAT